MMLSAILSDTDNLQSSTTTDLDRQAVADLEKKAGIQNRNAYFLAMEEELAAYKDMSDQEIFYSDYKEFTINGISYGCATVVALTKKNCLGKTPWRLDSEKLCIAKNGYAFLKNSRPGNIRSNYLLLW